MSRRRKKPRRKPKVSVESRVHDGPPGLTSIGRAEHIGPERLLVSECDTESGAVHHVADDSFSPTVFVNIKGRWNRTEMEADLHLILPPEAAIEIGKGLILAAERAPIDVQWHEAGRNDVG